jgi:hypothetical protein
MADITMCSGKGCDLKLNCHRFTANKSGWQAWFAEVPFKNGKCEMFWDNKSEQTYMSLKDFFNIK